MLGVSYPVLMGAPGSLSLEELIRLHNVVETSIPAMDLEVGMVARFDQRLRIVISVSFEHAEDGVQVTVETAHGDRCFPAQTSIPVWHIGGKPFFVDLPPEDLGQRMPPPATGSSSPPAHDAAGIVPVWRGPKRLN